MQILDEHATLVKNQSIDTNPARAEISNFEAGKVLIDAISAHEALLGAQPDTTPEMVRVARDSVMQHYLQGVEAPPKPSRPETGATVRLTKQSRDIAFRALGLMELDGRRHAEDPNYPTGLDSEGQLGQNRKIARLIMRQLVREDGEWEDRTSSPIAAASGQRSDNTHAFQRSASARVGKHRARQNRVA